MQLAGGGDDAVDLADFAKEPLMLAGSVLSTRNWPRVAPTSMTSWRAFNAALTAWPTVPVAPITTIFFICCSVLVLDVQSIVSAFGGRKKPVRLAGPATLSF